MATERIELLMDVVDVSFLEDAVQESYGNPHFNDHVVHGVRVPGCALAFCVRPDGLVYCDDCGAQVGKAPELGDGGEHESVIDGIWYRRWENGVALRGHHVELFPEYYKKREREES